MLLASCTQTKKKEMEKDAESLIEACQKAPGLSGITTYGFFMQSIQTKYEGADMMEFMDILRTEVLNRNRKGENCGYVQLLYMYDEEFRNLDNEEDDEKISNKTTIPNKSNKSKKANKSNK